MPRPKKSRMIFSPPQVRYFKPRGIPMKDLVEVYLTFEGYEALRLVDLEGLNQEEASRRMGVSRQTFGRVLAQARRSVSEALIHGLALRIEGGDFAVLKQPGKTTPLGQGRRVSVPLNTGEKVMKSIAVSAEGPSMDDPVDPRFGRAAGFLLVDPDTLATEYIDNGASQARAQGAGIQAAETLARAGVQVVLTGFVGPKAFAALSGAGIQVVQNLDGLTVRQAVEKFKNNAVTPSSAPNSPGGRN